MQSYSLHFKKPRASSTACCALDFFERDPEAFVTQHQNQVIFDEAQKVPLLFNYVMLATSSTAIFADVHKRPRYFVVSRKN